jgi:beta-glucanase (GH16 family)
MLEFRKISPIVVACIFSVVWFAGFSENKVTSQVCPKDNEVASSTLSDDVDSPNLNTCTWVVVQSNWGGKVNGEDYNGGVVGANVAVHDGVLTLTAHGNHYSGPIRGIGSRNELRPDGRRTGAAIRSRQRYIGGRFEARVKIIEHLGVVSAMWLFRYEEGADGKFHNHEIDIEFPGQADPDSPPRLDHVTLTTWTGLERGQSTAAFRALPRSIADGDFHLLRFDWRPPVDSKAGSVAFYIDGELQHVSDSNVPSMPANLWLGAWFPSGWAGEPEFAQATMMVDWVRVSPID